MINLKTLFVHFFAYTMSAISVTAQPALEWNKLPELPGSKGWAGMYAGVSHGTLVCMGGANFPEKLPWEGGKKKWYREIYVLKDGKNWIKSAQKLAIAAAYGVSVSYENKIILVGGSNVEGHLRRVVGYECRGNTFESSDYPDLPIPLANMTGTLLNDIMIVAGGSSSPAGPPLKKCYLLDLKNPKSGWVEITPWPGQERIFPVCAAFENKFYLFGGETMAFNALGEKHRLILQDGYSLHLEKQGNRWLTDWQILSPMPHGASAAGAILPVLGDFCFLFWGGVDAMTALHGSSATHPGITDSLLYYFPKTDTWKYGGRQMGIPARVTLPVVFWRNQWIYLSGEVRPGVRTPSVVGVR